MKSKSESYDVVVCGGGLAGLCAAIASARHGAKTCLVHDRPVLGGNASSEIRVTVHGAAAFHAYARETGILSEALIEERSRNHEEINENGWTNSVFDQVLYDMARETPLLTLHLNTSVQDALLGDGETSALSLIPARPLPGTGNGWFHRPACAPERRIAAVAAVAAVVARVANAETELTLRAGTFIDCTGDGLVADLAGCEWRMGSESRAQTGESHAPASASTNTMGNSIHIRARDIGKPAPFRPPEWARTITDPGFFYDQGRIPYDLRGGFWWIEIGIPWHTIYDNETIRHELTAWALGIWDWIKNRDETLRGKAANYALEWIGQVPGKRESRRIMGRYLITEEDIQKNVVHPDEIAYGGWFVDLHTPGGLLAEHAEPASAEGYVPDSDYAVKSYVGPYGIPLRACLSKDVDNLLLAGRCLSATHAALGTVRVMATTALVGQAVGTAAALALVRGTPLPELPSMAGEIQQRLLRDGCFLLNSSNRDDSDLARKALVSSSSEALSYGMGVRDPWASGGLGQNPDVPSSPLDKGAAQWMAVSGGLVETVSFCLENRSGQTGTVSARLVRPDHIWDYRRDLPVLAETILPVPCSRECWIDWPVNLTGVPDGYLRLDLEGDSSGIGWLFAKGILPGQVAGWAMSAQRLRRMGLGVTMAFRIAPGQPVYSASNLLSGVTRPRSRTNLWRSNPGEPLPQWVQLEWEGPEAFSRVELTFPGHLLRELHATPPFFRDPQIPRDYTIEEFADGGWQPLVEIRDNYQRHRRHDLDRPATSDRLRVVIHSTNGDPCAAVHEIRVYR